MGPAGRPSGGCASNEQGVQHGGGCVSARRSRSAGDARYCRCCPGAPAFRGAGTKCNRHCDCDCDCDCRCKRHCHNYPISCGQLYCDGHSGQRAYLHSHSGSLADGGFRGGSNGYARCQPQPELNPNLEPNPEQHCDAHSGPRCDRHHRKHDYAYRQRDRDCNLCPEHNCHANDNRSPHCNGNRDPGRRASDGIGHSSRRGSHVAGAACWLRAAAGDAHAHRLCQRRLASTG